MKLLLEQRRETWDDGAAWRQGRPSPIHEHDLLFAFLAQLTTLWQLSCVPFEFSLPADFGNFTEEIKEGDKLVGWRHPGSKETLKWEGESPHGPHWDWQGATNEKGQRTKIRLRSNGLPLDSSEAKKLNSVIKGKGTARRGFISPDLIKSLGATVIVAGATYYYDHYVSTGEKICLDLVDRIGLGQILQQYGTQGELPGRYFQISRPGRPNVKVLLVPDVNDRTKWYVTAHYTVDRWWLFVGSFKEDVDIITTRHNIVFYVDESVAKTPWEHGKPK